MCPYELLTTLLLVPAYSPTDGGPALRFAAQQTLRQSWSIAVETEVERSVLRFSEDQEQDVGSGSSVASTRTLEAVDTVRAADGGRLGTVRRDFKTLQSGRDVAGLEDGEGLTVTEGGETSPLEGLAVTFTRGEDGEFVAAWADDEKQGEDEWLPGLRAEGFLAGMLPGEEVSEGARWEVSAAFLAELLEPLGDVDVEVEPEAPDVPEGGIVISLRSPDDFLDWASFEGTITARWVATETEDGPRRARIELELDLETSVDLSSAFEEAAAKRGADEPYSSAQLERKVEGRVIVLWNLDTNLPLSVEGELEGSLDFDAAWTLSNGDFELELETELESTQTMTLAASFTVE